MSFVVRSLPAATSLDGAFRLHLLPEHLEQVGLNLGDLCEITNENGSAVGYGIAWRATEKMGTNPKNRPVKATEILQTAYNVREGSQIMLYRSDMKVVPADEVVLTDVSPDRSSENGQNDLEGANLKWRCGYALSKLHLTDNNDESRCLTTL